MDIGKEGEVFVAEPMPEPIEIPAETPAEVEVEREKIEVPA
jgi:hypothetical protein